MSATLRRLLDRQEIREVLTRYAHVVDRDAWEALDEVFTADGVFDARATGLPQVPGADIEAVIRSTRSEARTGGRHFIANVTVWLDGDTARAYSEIWTDRFDSSDDPQAGVFRPTTGFYLDELVRTPAGWRIAVRRPYIKSSLAIPVRTEMKIWAAVAAGRAASTRTEGEKV